MITFRQKQYSIEQRNYMFGGYGRGLFLGGLHGMWTAKKAKEDVDYAKSQGANDYHAAKFAKKRGRIRRSIWSGLKGAVLGGLYGGLGGAVIGGLSGATVGAAKGHIIASKSADSRITGKE